MGCDIHAHIEYTKVCGRYFAKAIIPRNYALFSYMAGVRAYGQVEPVVPPRGLPDNMEEETREDYDEQKRDAHTPSYLNYTEFKLAYDRASEEFAGRCRVTLAYLAAMKVLDRAGFNPRIVFWFDN